MVIAGISLVAAVTFLVTWYWVWRRHKRTKAQNVLRWIQASLAGHGQVMGLSWTAASSFRVPLRLKRGVFHRAWAIVNLRSEPTPFQWLLHKFLRQRETLTFQADLDLPPAFSLYVHNFRWFARSSRRTPVNHPGWRFEQLPPLIITTSPEQHKDLACTAASLSKGNTTDFLNISFQRYSPHFSATVLLESLSPGAPERTHVLDAMRELAGSSSASLF